MLATLPIVQIVLGALLIVGVLLQQSEAGLGTAFGGGDEGSVHRTRRGPEKVIFNGTIVVAILFVISTFIALII